MKNLGVKYQSKFLLIIVLALVFAMSALFIGFKNNESVKASENVTTVTAGRFIRAGLAAGTVHNVYFFFEHDIVNPSSGTVEVTNHSTYLDVIKVAGLTLREFQTKFGSNSIKMFTVGTQSKRFQVNIYRDDILSQYEFRELNFKFEISSNFVAPNGKQLDKDYSFTYVQPWTYNVDSQPSSNYSTTSLSNITFAKNVDGGINQQINLYFEGNISNVASNINVVDRISSHVRVGGKTLYEIQRDYGANQVEVWALSSNLLRLAINIKTTAFTQFIDVNNDDFEIEVLPDFIGQNGAALTDGANKTYLQKYNRIVDTSAAQTEIAVTSATLIKNADVDNHHIYIFFDGDICDDGYTGINIINNISNDISLNGYKLADILNQHSNSLQAWLRLHQKNSLQINLRKTTFADLIDEDIQLTVFDSFIAFSGAKAIQETNLTYIQNIARFVSTANTEISADITGISFDKQGDGNNHQIIIDFDADVSDVAINTNIIGSVGSYLSINGFTLNQINSNIGAGTVQIWSLSNNLKQLIVNVNKDSFSNYLNVNNGKLLLEISEDFIGYNGVNISGELNYTFNVILPSIISPYDPLAQMSLNVTAISETQLFLEVNGGKNNYAYQFWVRKKVSTDDVNYGYIWYMSRSFVTDNTAYVDLTNDIIDNSGNISVIARVKDADGKICDELFKRFTAEDLSLPVISNIFINDRVADEIFTVIRNNETVSILIDGNISNAEYKLLLGTNEYVAEQDGSFVIDFGSFPSGYYTFTAVMKYQEITKTKNFRVYVYQDFDAATVPVIISVDNYLDDGDVIFTVNVEYAGGGEITSSNGIVSALRAEGASVIHINTIIDNGVLKFIYKAEYNNKAGIYQIRAEVSRANNDKDHFVIFYYSGLARSASLSISSDIDSENYEAAKDDTVEITLTGGIEGVTSSNLRYAFYREDAGGWVLIKNYSVSNKLEWTPSRSGTYVIQGRVKDVNGGSYEKTVTQTYNIIGEKLLGELSLLIKDFETNLYVDSSTLVIGRLYIIEAQYTGTENALFKFTLGNSSVGLIYLNSYSTSNMLFYIPNKIESVSITARVINAYNYGYKDITANQTLSVILPVR